MVADNITPHFRDLVQEVSTASGRRKDKGQSLEAAQLLRSLAARTAFTKASNEIAHDITALRQFLRENQYAYAQTGRMSEAEGDRLEGEVGAVVRACSANIQRLQGFLGDAGEEGMAPDMAAHRAGAVLALSERLGATSAAYDRLRALRRQQEEQSAALRRVSAAPTGRVGTPVVLSPGRRLPPPPTDQHHHPRQQAMLAQHTDRESAALAAELAELSGAVAQAESSVREVAALNQAFSAAVAHQTGQIEVLYAEAVRTSRHIGGANVQLGKTVAANRGAQRALLIFLLLATLGLIFMDWWHS